MIVIYLAVFEAEKVDEQLKSREINKTDAAV